MADRALNEAVARAMGWTFTTYPDGLEIAHWHPPGMTIKNSAKPCPSYFTDPATQAEMLAWLLQHTTGSIAIDVDDTASARCRAWGGTEEVGATINEALARLVVAVAEREAGK